MNILIRANSSSYIGIGHIMRGLVLVKQYSNDNIIFATENLDGNINHKIIEAGYKIELLKSNSFDELNELIKKLNIDMIIIDNYEINYNFEKNLKELNPSLKIFVFDDTYEKHFCDILINHNISANEKKYKNLVPNNCELRCGSKYTLLRDEFLEAKKQKNSIKKDKKIKTIFVAMGGADHSNINIDILKVVNKIRKKNKKNIKVNIVSTNANKNLEKLKNYCKNKKWINLYINSKQIAKLMSESDFAIVTPSVTVNEVYYLKLPIIAIKTADNQIDIYRYLKKKRFSVLKKFKINKLVKLIKEKM
ncbi:UDP-2,4-diacetamido-2,4,6-trideoxy-beta-L-altropyranose hydrolase [Arcobacter aquimarinus]|uniref:UDP-2,4-diacetamido-2,4, 6-trideoxy-beta-L-altropyranosyl transferase n=1 Tax=Arcobacter aquimarinus TaxID=1315211 RepID=A0AAE7E1W5_9BACT|nr:UDP-2,4-diacetamido-2,4,6-trideoxy-beta-L-altropyranose hydrolase [Arcobacter aquimarinus]QKE27070.1 UDP-2,4-diacetamido-2,4,6-trideoxy-beta-L-altropyranosyl transferase [Arcobacter aquimarinus]RXI30265.1 UDP-2,4-diacetamido-2,4,6-trideoxy-beta-L-altropyranose hydrolase [Arcobacter aquimarinus]